MIAVGALPATTESFAAFSSDSFFGEIAVSDSVVTFRSAGTDISSRAGELLLLPGLASVPLGLFAALFADELFVAADIFELAAALEFDFA